MSHPNTSLWELEQSRMEKLRELGYLTYNLSVNGKALPSSQWRVVNQMRDTVGLMSNSDVREMHSPRVRQYRMYLDEKATELGLLCYNDSIDRGYGPGGIERLLAEINHLNGEISRQQNDADSEYEGQKTGKGGPAEDSALQVDIPYGMERIPDDYKRCACGYRNRGYARYCGRCGVKLPS